MVLHFYQRAKLFATSYFINFGKNSKQLEFAHIAGGNRKWSSHFGKQGITSYKSTIHPIFSSLDINYKEIKYVQL